MEPGCRKFGKDLGDLDGPYSKTSKKGSALGKERLGRHPKGTNHGYKMKKTDGKIQSFLS